VAVDGSVRGGAATDRAGKDAQPDAVRELVAGVLGERAHTDRLQRLVALQHGSSAAICEETTVLDELDPAIAELLDKVARHAYRVSDEDVARAREAGCSDDELYDLIVATAAGAGLARRALGRAAVARWERQR
jgi:alkylhydroperoxidase family enzyme